MVAKKNYTETSPVTFYNIVLLYSVIANARRHDVLLCSCFPVCWENLLNCHVYLGYNITIVHSPRKNSQLVFRIGPKYCAPHHYFGFNNASVTVYYLRFLFFPGKLGHSLSQGWTDELHHYTSSHFSRPTFLQAIEKSIRCARQIKNENSVLALPPK